MAGDYLFQYLTRYKVTIRLRHYVEKPKNDGVFRSNVFTYRFLKKILDFDGTSNSGKKYVGATLGITDNTSIYST